MTGERNGKNVGITQRQFLALLLTEEEGIRHLNRTEFHSSALCMENHKVWNEIFTWTCLC